MSLHDELVEITQRKKILIEIKNACKRGENVFKVPKEFMDDNRYFRDFIKLKDGSITFDPLLKMKGSVFYKECVRDYNLSKLNPKEIERIKKLLFIAAYNGENQVIFGMGGKCINAFPDFRVEKGEEEEIIISWGEDK